jgi:hypothetical protein
VQRVGTADLGVELEGPGALAEPGGLEAGLAAGEGDGPGGKGELVAVPLEGLEARSEGAEQRVVFALRRHLHPVPADLRPGRAPRLGARRRGQELTAEAETEQRHLARQQLPQQRLLLGDPAVPLAFVGVHRPAEDEDRVVAGRVGRRLRTLGQRPLVEHPAGLPDRLGEDARARIALVDDRQDSHPPSLSPPE